MILAVPIGLVRLILNLLRLLGRALKWLVLFLLSLPGRLGRGLWKMAHFFLRLPGQLWHGFKRAVRFLVSLPGRLWQGLKWAVRWVLSLPERARQGGRRFKAALYRLRLRGREWRDRFAAWRRARAPKPRTLSPRAQLGILLTLALHLTITALLGWALGRTLRRVPETVVVTATPAEASPQPTTSSPHLPTPTPLVAAPDVPSGSSSLSPIDEESVVAFALRRNGNTDVYARKLIDDQLLQLTYHPQEDREPAWAPEGETLGFVSHRGNNWDIYQLDLVSGALIRLTRDAHYDAHPTWSHDGAFIAFESYRSGNLDIYIMAADGSQILQLTSNRAADFAPAWSPDGRHIAFVSCRDGSKDIFLYPLDAGSESAIINLTQTPDRDEDAPAWSPDGRRLTFSGGRFGAETIYITTFDWSSKFLDEAQIQLFNPGTKPDWSPTGQSLVYAYQRVGQAFLIADSVTGWGGGREIFSSDAQVQDPSWGAPTVDPEQLVERRSSTSLSGSALYIEEIRPTPESGPPYSIMALEDVNGGDDREFLSDRVNDSFEALRQRVLQETGIDYLGTIGDSFRRITVPPPPGQSPRSWHKAGRAFDLNQGLYEREERLVELVREDIGFRTYWRVYLRTERQDGSQGQPLRQAPWDLKARRDGGLAAREGGQLMSAIPLGYYVDLTQLAADYGWERVPANNRWREEWADINWWQFRKTQGLTWLEAMLEFYRPDEIEAVFGPLSQEKGEPIP